METRYKDADKRIRRMVSNMIRKEFSHLNSVNIKVILDTKPKKTQGRYRLGEMKKANDMDKFLSKSEENAFEGWHFIMILDEGLVQHAKKEDIKRVIFHELCHAGFTDKGECTTLPHEFEGFYMELDYNQDDPQWKERMFYITAAAHGDE